MVSPHLDLCSLVFIQVTIHVRFNSLKEGQGIKMADSITLSMRKKAHVPRAFSVISRLEYKNTGL